MRRPMKIGLPIWMDTLPQVRPWSGGDAVSPVHERATLPSTISSLN